jgi:hypothetical protein
MNRRDRILKFVCKNLSALLAITYQKDIKKCAKIYAVVL